MECRCIYGVGNFVPTKQKFRDLYALLRSEEPRMTRDVQKAEENVVKLLSKGSGTITTTTSLNHTTHATHTTHSRAAACPSAVSDGPLNTAARKAGTPATFRADALSSAASASKHGPAGGCMLRLSEEKSATRTLSSCTYGGILLMDWMQRCSACC